MTALISSIQHIVCVSFCSLLGFREKYPRQKAEAEKGNRGKEREEKGLENEGRQTFCEKD